MWSRLSVRLRCMYWRVESRTSIGLRSNARERTWDRAVFFIARISARLRFMGFPHKRTCDNFFFYAKISARLWIVSFPHERTWDKCFFYARISARLRILSFPHEHTCGFFSTRQYLACMFQLQSYPVASGPRIKRRIDGRGWVVVQRFLRRVPNCTFLIITGVIWILMLNS